MARTNAKIGGAHRAVIDTPALTKAFRSSVLEKLVGTTEAIQPAFSPDGQYILYKKQTVLGSGIGASPGWVVDRMNLTTTEVKSLMVYDLDVFDMAAYSPDGNSIVFGCNRGGTWNICVADSVGQNIRNLTNSTAGVSNSRPRFSPDGNWIVFDSDRGGSQDIWTIDKNGASLTRLTSYPGDKRMASFSPDGNLMVFRSAQASGSKIYVMDKTGTNVRQISGEYSDWYPSFSPDGNSILFVSDRSGNNEIYLMDLNGGSVRNLTNHASNDNYPIFSSDGSWIAFVSDRDGSQSSIYRMSFGTVSSW